MINVNIRRVWAFVCNCCSLYMWHRSNNAQIQQLDVEQTSNWEPHVRRSGLTVFLAMGRRRLQLGLFLRLWNRSQYALVTCLHCIKYYTSEKAFCIILMPPCICTKCHFYFAAVLYFSNAVLGRHSTLCHMFGSAPDLTRCSAIAERPRCRVHYSFRQK